ncbi:MAG: thioredoxin domain-containing protein [Terriglobales bacterium]
MRRFAAAGVVMVEFTGLQCPFCRAFPKTNFRRLKKEYREAGQVRFVARDLPLPLRRAVRVAKRLGLDLSGRADSTAAPGR